MAPSVLTQDTICALDGQPIDKASASFIKAVDKLDPDRALVFSQLWREARAAHEGRLCPDGADAAQGLTPDRVVLEITEKSAIENYELFAEALYLLGRVHEQRREKGERQASTEHDPRPLLEALGAALDDLLTEADRAIVFGHSMGGLVRFSLSTNLVHFRLARRLDAWTGECLVRAYLLVDCGNGC